MVENIVSNVRRDYVQATVGPKYFYGSMPSRHERAVRDDCVLSIQSVEDMAQNVLKLYSDNVYDDVVGGTECSISDLFLIV